MNIFTLVFLILKSTRCSTVIDVYSQQSSLVSNYCEKTDYCDEGTHVMCMYHNQDKKIGPACHSYVSTTMTSEMVDQILDIVNNIRSKVATGIEIGKNGQTLPRAYGMMLMKWDHELATFAQVLADQCFGGREDECRSTSKFPHPSQGSGIIQFKFPDWQYLTLNTKNATSSENKGLSKEKIYFAIDRFFKATYALKKTVTSEMIIKCPSVSELSHTKARYFLNLIRGTASHVGCGISAYTRFNTVVNTKQSIYNAIEIVCNFSDRPQPSEPLYISDPPVPGAGFSAECGCPEGYKEVSGCLCEESHAAVWPKFTIKEKEKLRVAPKKVAWRPNPPQPKNPAKPPPLTNQQPVLRLPAIKNTASILMRPKVQSWTKLQQQQSKPETKTQTQKPPETHLPKLTKENEVRSDIVKMLQLIKKKAILQALNKTNNVVRSPAEKTRAKIVSTGKSIRNNNAQKNALGAQEMPKFMTILDTLEKEVQNYKFDQDRKEYFDNKMKTIFETVEFNFKEQLKPEGGASPSSVFDEQDGEAAEVDKDFNSLMKIKREGNYNFNSIRQRTEADTPSPTELQEQENLETESNHNPDNAADIPTPNENEEPLENPYDDTPLEEITENTNNTLLGNEAIDPTVGTSTVDNPTVDNPTVDNPRVDSPTVDNPTVDSPSEMSSSEHSPSSYQNVDPFRNDEMESMSFKSEEVKSDTETDTGLHTDGPNSPGRLNYFESAKRRAYTNRIYRRMLDTLHPLKHAFNK